MIDVTLVNYIGMIHVFICLIVKNVYKTVDIVSVFTIKVVVMGIKVG